MEEKKDVCCEGKDKECCEIKGAACCHHNWKKCHMIRKIVWIIMIIVAFCLGSQFGELKSEVRNSRFERGPGMMNWGRYNNLEQDFYKGNQATSQVRVDVTKNPDTTTPAPKQ